MMRVLYLFPRPSEPDLAEVHAGRAPGDRMYGLVELRRYGHEVTAADSRFTGRGAAAIRWARRHNVNLCDFRTLGQIRAHDVVVAKDDFSAMLTTGARLVRTPIVYVDALFQPPRWAWQSAALHAHLSLANGVVVYSEAQRRLWLERYRVPESRLKILPYTIDTDFYRPVPAPPPGPRPYVLSVGRDLGRQFSTLVTAMEGLDLDLTLVTLPYLLDGIDAKRPWINLQQRVPYADLFALYAGALLVVIPLKAGILYPAGIRGLLEALALGCPAIASRTAILEEYVADGAGVRYVDADDPSALRQAIVHLAGAADERAALAERGQALVRSRFHMDAFGRGLETYLESLL